MLRWMKTSGLSFIVILDRCRAVLLCCNLARSANLLEGLYILPSVSFFFISSFLMISRRQIISRSTGPIFVIFTSNESILAVDDRSGPFFSISQGTLPWQPILCKNGQNCLPILHLSLCHSETEWAIVLRMSAKSSTNCSTSCKKNGENRFSSVWVKPG